MHYILTSAGWEVVIPSLAHATFLADVIFLTRTLSPIYMADVSLSSIHITVTWDTVWVTIVTNTTTVNRIDTVEPV